MRLLACFLLTYAVALGQKPKLVPTPLPTEQLRGTVPAAAALVLRGMAARAGVIFAGHVLEVQHNDAGGFVDVVFSVDEAVRGCAGSKQYVVREWAGLWVKEPMRYGVGQKLLMILPARGASGMSAPMGGMAGRMPLVGVRPAVLARGTGSAPADTGATAGMEESVDLRWVEAAAARNSAVGVKAQAELGRGVGSGWAGPAVAMEATQVTAAGPGLSDVLAVLGER